MKPCLPFIAATIYCEIFLLAQSHVTLLHGLNYASVYFLCPHFCSVVVPSFLPLLRRALLSHPLMLPVADGE